MAWSPTPASPKHTWQGYDLCLNIYNDGMGDAIAADPKDFVEFQAWASTHTTWVDAPKSVSASME